MFRQVPCWIAKINEGGREKKATKKKSRKKETKGVVGVGVGENLSNSPLALTRMDSGFLGLLGFSFFHSPFFKILLFITF